jgi:hypothetical protein
VWAADTLHVRGTVASVDGSFVKIETNDGKEIGLTIGADWKIAGVIPASLANVKKASLSRTANVRAQTVTRNLRSGFSPKKCAVGVREIMVGI